MVYTKIIQRFKDYSPVEIDMDPDIFHNSHFFVSFDGYVCG